MKDIFATVKVREERDAKQLRDSTAARGSAPKSPLSPLVHNSIFL